MINCSDKCIHSNDGLCTLNHIMYSSNEGNDNCLFFKNVKNSKKLVNYSNLQNLK